MSESGDYEPAENWSGHDFATARDTYKDVASRSYAKAVAIDVKPESLVPDEVSTDCESPLVIAIDVTGSMEEWPITIFSKLPYLEHEADEYLGTDVEISFAAIGDHTCSDRYPLQVQPFVRGSALKESLEKLIHEKGGGGDSDESYELAGLYYAKNCHTPKSIRKPLMIIIGDEGIHSILAKADADRLCKTDIEESRLTPQEIFCELRKKFEVYIIRKPYQVFDNHGSAANTRVQNLWESLLGADHVVSLPDPQRVVDVIFGILGQFTGRYDEFVEELNERQGKDKDGQAKINVVLKSLRSIRDPDDKKSMKKLPSPSTAKSVTHRKDGDSKTGTKSISLLDDEE